MSHEPLPEPPPQTEPDAPIDAVVPELPARALGHDTPIFLVGMMGAGKTTIGKALARALRRDFLDLDHELEARCGVRIPVIFEIEGEKGFRKRECQVLDDCTVRPLRTRGLVVYLRASVDELFRRTSRDRNRPLLATPDPKGTLRSLLEAREPLYQEVADLAVDTGTISVGQLVLQIIDRLKQLDKPIDRSAQSRPANSSENMRADFAASHTGENKPCIP